MSRKAIRTANIMRYGSCINCGKCCETLFHVFKSKRVTCQYYDLTKEQHCTIYPQRPKVCRNYPRGPMDLNRVFNCNYWFADENGRIVDGCMDKRVQLTKIGYIPK